MCLTQSSRALSHLHASLLRASEVGAAAVSMLSGHPTQEPGPSNAGRPVQVGEVTDALFGTRSHTQGAKYQIPRKIPLRIEPKTYFGKLSLSEVSVVAMMNYLALMRLNC